LRTSITGITNANKPKLILNNDPFRLMGNKSARERTTVHETQTTAHKRLSTVNAEISVPLLLTLLVLTAPKY